MFYLNWILQITFLLKILPLYTLLYTLCFANKFYDIQSNGFMKDNINFVLRLRRTYGLLPLPSWPTACFWVWLRVSRRKFRTIRLILNMNRQDTFCELCILIVKLRLTSVKQIFTNERRVEKFNNVIPAGSKKKMKNVTHHFASPKLYLFLSPHLSRVTGNIYLFYPYVW